MLEFFSVSILGECSDRGRYVRSALNGFVSQQFLKSTQHIVMRYIAKDLLSIKPNRSQFALVLVLDNFIKQNQFLRSNNVVSEGTLVLADETFFQ